jgi:hypothetical protein
MTAGVGLLNGHSPARTTTPTRAQRSVAAAAICEDYQPSVGEFLRFMEPYRGAEPGDPALAARAPITIAGAEEPPLRLLLGSDALHVARAAAIARSEETEKWAELRVSTDYPESA